MPDNDDLKIKKLLTDNGYHWTRVRYEVFKLLLNSEPQSTNEILAKARGKVDRVSVYRSLSLFEKLGIIHRISLGWKYKLELSDQFVAHHHHLSCTSCGRLIDIEDEQHINDFISKVANKFGFRPVRHQFEIEGLCKDCSVLKQQPA